MSSGPLTSIISGLLAALLLDSSTQHIAGTVSNLTHGGQYIVVPDNSSTASKMSEHASVHEAWGEGGATPNLPSFEDITIHLNETNHRTIAEFSYAQGLSPCLRAWQLYSFVGTELCVCVDNSTWLDAIVVENLEANRHLIAVDMFQDTASVSTPEPFFE